MTVGETHRTTERRWVKNWVRGGTEGAALKREQIIILFLVRACLKMAILPRCVIFCQSRSLISLASPPTSYPLSFHYIFWLIQKKLKFEQALASISLDLRGFPVLLKAWNFKQVGKTTLFPRVFLGGKKKVPITGYCFLRLLWRT